ncbi:hypothetical protein K440DRAFT_12620 [Wilcoxina mikolae CBS 423.85]|nr:hypothetical protein K440DRAFT_12620 [Wilcoxina mikolae CBS 423.85]
MWSVSVFDMAVRFPRCAEDQPESTTIGDSSDLSQLCGDCKLVSKCWSIECMLQPQTCDPGSLAQMAHPIQSKAKCDEEHAFERSHCIRKALYPLSGMTEREKLWIRRREYVWRLKDRLEALERQSLERERLERERIRMERLHSEPY